MEEFERLIVVLNNMVFYYYGQAEPTINFTEFGVEEYALTFFINDEFNQDLENRNEESETLFEDEDVLIAAIVEEIISKKRELVPELDENDFEILVRVINDIFQEEKYTLEFTFSEEEGQESVITFVTINNLSESTTEEVAEVDAKARLAELLAEEQAIEDNVIFPKDVDNPP